MRADRLARLFLSLLSVAFVALLSYCVQLFLDVKSLEGLVRDTYGLSSQSTVEFLKEQRKELLKDENLSKSLESLTR